MNWKFWKSKPKEVKKEIKNRDFQRKRPIFEVGQKYVDKEWGDTIIEITAISKSKEQVRYKFLMIDGEKIPNSSIYTINVTGLRNYTLFKDEKDRVTQT